MKPSVTTLIPTYRRPNRLRRAIVSVLMQDFSEVRVLVFDNASGDETARVVAGIREADPRVEYHCHDANLGAVANFNFALQRVDTPYFSILSDDDMVLPGFYSVAVESLTANPGAGFFCGRSIVFNETQDVVHPSRACWPDSSEGPQARGYDSVMKMIDRHFCWTGVLWRKGVIESVGQVDAFGSDDNYLVRAAGALPFEVSDRACALSFHHDGRFSFDPTGLDAGREAHAPYLDWLLGRADQLKTDLARLDELTPDQRDSAIQRVSRRTVRELVLWLAQHSIPNNRPRELRTIHARVVSEGAGCGLAMLTRLLAGTYDQFPRLGDNLSRILGLIRRRAIDRRKRHQKGSNLDQTMRAFVDQVDGWQGDRVRGHSAHAA